MHGSGQLCSMRGILILLSYWTTRLHIQWSLWHCTVWLWGIFLHYIVAFNKLIFNYLYYRMLHKHSWLLKAFISLAFLSYYINYFAYITVGQFSYSLNMTTNIITGELTTTSLHFEMSSRLIKQSFFSGALSALGWFLWSFRVRKQRPYYRKILGFYLLLGMSMSLELLDFPPIFWILDAHALWHLSTIFIMNPLYSFAIDDCRLLRTEKYYESVGYDKEIWVMIWTMIVNSAINIITSQNKLLLSLYLFSHKKCVPYKYCLLFLLCISKIKWKMGNMYV